MLRRLLKGLIKSPKENIVRSRFPNIEIPNLKLDEYVFANIDKWPDKIALECLETGRSITYYQLQKKTISLARFLRGPLGLKKGDTIAVALKNIPEYAVVVLGGSAADLKVTTINPLYTQEEIRRQLIDSKSKIVVTLPELWKKVLESSRDLPHQANIPLMLVKHQADDIIPQNAILLDEICERDFKHPLNSPHSDETCLLLYSSGTTGLPKGVELTHRNLVANLSQITHADLRINVDTTKNQQDVLPLFLPMFHVYGLTSIMLTMLSQGCKVITVPKYGTEALIKLCQRHKPTIMHAVPPIILAFTESLAIKPEHLETVRTIVSAAAPLGATDVERFHKKTKGAVDLIQLYGLTETSPVITLQSSKVEDGIKIGGSGLLVPNTECKVVPLDDLDHPGLGPGTSGELLFKGPQVMKGYYNNEKATKDTFAANKWLKTGDIGHYDEDGHFFITDRLKELIKVKGFQVAPAELEEILRAHPHVADAAVVGVPDTISGELPRAFIVPKETKRVHAAEIQEYVDGKVTEYKKLKGGVVLIDSIPKNAAGKILRRQLKAMSDDVL